MFTGTWAVMIWGWSAPVTESTLRSVTCLWIRSSSASTSSAAWCRSTRTDRVTVARAGTRCSPRLLTSSPRCSWSPWARPPPGSATLSSLAPGRGASATATWGGEAAASETCIWGGHWAPGGEMRLPFQCWRRVASHSSTLQSAHHPGNIDQSQLSILLLTNHSSIFSCWPIKIIFLIYFRLIPIEASAMDNARILLFVIQNNSRSVGVMSQAAYLIGSGKYSLLIGRHKLILASDWFRLQRGALCSTHWSWDNPGLWRQAEWSCQVIDQSQLSIFNHWPIKAEYS